MCDGTSGRHDEPLLELRNVSVRFGSVMALREVSLGVRRGESIALVGANGSGKTTLLRALHGVVAHSGQRIVRPADERGRLAVQGMVYQRPFMMRVSVGNNLRLAAWLGRLPRHTWPDRIDEALQRVGLSGLGERPARALSGGQQQRLALARAWMLRPDILFLDEPTASLDPTAKKEVEAILTGFSRDGMSVVMSTHNLGQAKRLAERIIYLEDGLIKVDQPGKVFFAGAARDALDKVDLFLKGELSWQLE